MLPNMQHLLLSCSHDGAVRCLDLGGGSSAAFTEVYRAAEDSDGDYPSLHFLSRTAGEGGGPAGLPPLPSNPHPRPRPSPNSLT